MAISEKFIFLFQNRGYNTIQNNDKLLYRYSGNPKYQTLEKNYTKVYKL